MDIGKAIKSNRKRQELTQDALAARLPLGVDKGYISRVEHNLIDVRFTTLCMFADALDMHTSTLLLEAEQFTGDTIL